MATSYVQVQGNRHIQDSRVIGTAPAGYPCAEMGTARGRAMFLGVIAVAADLGAPEEASMPFFGPGG
jgi:hypothetical protein